MIKYNNISKDDILKIIRESKDVMAVATGERNNINLGIRTYINYGLSDNSYIILNQKDINNAMIIENIIFFKVDII